MEELKALLPEIEEVEDIIRNAYHDQLIRKGKVIQHSDYKKIMSLLSKVQDIIDGE